MHHLLYCTFFFVDCSCVLICSSPLYSCQKSTGTNLILKRNWNDRIHGSRGSRNWILNSEGWAHICSKFGWALHQGCWVWEFCCLWTSGMNLSLICGCDASLLKDRLESSSSPLFSPYCFTQNEWYLVCFCRI